MMNKQGDGQKSHFAQIEEEILKIWETEKTFEKSVTQREGAPHFEFYDGPPFANGLPHFGHSLVMGIKDSMLRYKTMRGMYVPRRNGWDCHGLPVEFAIEKEFKVSGKKQIMELGLEKFNAACRDSIFRYKADWEEFMKRIGRWSDYDKHYATVDREYTESVWWILSEINKKGLLYRGFKSLPYCPRCETPLSNFELNEGYRDNVPDPSVFVTFPLIDEPTTAFLAWTTTPWTLPANAALAVDPKADYAYAKLKIDGQTLILAKSRLSELSVRKADYRVLKTVKGQELVGMKYQPLYPLDESKYQPNQIAAAHKIYADMSVEIEDGTGILHVAPRYGETDLLLGQKENLPLIESVNSSGQIVFPQKLSGQFFKQADPYIIAELTKANRIFAAETKEHTYPFCWRCDTPLMYFATTTWFVAVSKIREEMLKTAQDINWVPGHIKDGRFGKWLEGARDWAISRNRYWGAPLPICVNTEDENDYLIAGSVAELKELAGDDIEVEDLHRPFIDKINFERDGKTYKRVEEVLDCWFESGSMPIAQWHYPFENKDMLDKSLPSDFVTEGLDQTRLWFYVQHVICTIIFGRPAFKNVVVNGILLAADGQKLSKRLKNYPPVEEVFAVEGADALRLYLLSSTQATESADYLRFNRDRMVDISRNVLGTLQNSHRFFDTYSKLDNWKPKIESVAEPPKSDNLMDRWIIARVDEAVHQVTKSADNFKISHAILPIFNIVDDLSNWYIRRSRKRFWKSENDNDKNYAYDTLHYCLIKVCQLLAPWAPFTSENLWRQLVDHEKLPKSVHLSDWPSVNKLDNTSHKLLDNMALARQFIVEGLAQRAKAGIKVRQPLSAVKVPHIDIDFHQIIADELNVKRVIINPDSKVLIDTIVSPQLKKEGISRELIRSVQNSRKKAGFKVEDRINLLLFSDSAEINKAISAHKDTIWAETLTTGELTEEPEHIETVKIDGMEVLIKLRRQ